MSAYAIEFDVLCAACRCRLTLDEMYFFERPEQPGTANCQDCELKAQTEADAFRRGLPAPYTIQ